MTPVWRCLSGEITLFSVTHRFDVSLGNTPADDRSDVIDVLCWACIALPLKCDSKGTVLLVISEPLKRQLLHIFSASKCFLQVLSRLLENESLLRALLVVSLDLSSSFLKASPSPGNGGSVSIFYVCTFYWLLEVMQCCSCYLLSRITHLPEL